MIRLLLGALGVLASPVVLVTTLALLAGSALSASCPTSQTLAPVPHQLRATATDGLPVMLNRTQLTHAATIITVGQTTTGVGHDGLVVALMAGLTESGLRMYANSAAYPHSTSFSHDGDAADHDSLGIFQMRPAAGWGTVGQLMDPTYQARAFFGGPEGPNAGSPRGLLDIPDWQTLPKGAAAQAVEVSAYPDRYARYEPVAEAILTALTTPAPGASPVLGAASGRAVFPLPEGTWTHTSGYGWRLHPVQRVWRLHTGTDLAAPAGTPVLATAGGQVVAAGPTAGLGNRIIVEHTTTNGTVASAYGHLRDGGIHVTAGDLVRKGQHIGDVGSTGNSTGPHLHFEIHPGGAAQPAIDPQPWLEQAAHLSGDDVLATPASSCTVITGSSP
ncbi:MAG: M23 family metallopeptidase [Cellulomonadaceae bacterium]